MFYLLESLCPVIYQLQNDGIVCLIQPLSISQSLTVTSLFFPFCDNRWKNYFNPSMRGVQAEA